MNAAIAAHIRILESLPQERIRTHRSSSLCPDEALGRKLAGVRMSIPEDMLSRYSRLRKAGVRFLDIKRELRVSTRTMARLRAMVRGG